MAGNLRNINAQVSCTMSKVRVLLQQFETMQTPKDLDSLIEDSGKLVNEIRELVAVVTLTVEPLSKLAGLFAAEEPKP